MTLTTARHGLGSRLRGGLAWGAGGVAAAACLLPPILGLGALGALGTAAEGIALAALALLGGTWLLRRARRTRAPAEGACPGEGEEAPAAPIACDLGALEAGERRAHAETARALFTAVPEAVETPRGFAFRLPDPEEGLLRAARFVAGERRCCPFLRFSLVAEPAGGPTWLELGGPPAVKRYVRENVVARWERETGARATAGPAG